MGRILNISEQALLVMKRKELLDRSNLAMITLLTRCEQFKIIKNVISQTVFLWNDFNRVTGIIT